jgi:hemerythrin superfamily protein
MLLTGELTAFDAECDAEVEKLMGLLSVHNRKEENVLYPMVDEAVDAAGRRRLFQEMKEIPPERYAPCCS